MKIKHLAHIILDHMQKIFRTNYIEDIIVFTKLNKGIMYVYLENLKIFSFKFLSSNLRL